MKTIKDVFLSFQQALEKLYDPRETGAITRMVLEEITGLSSAQIKAFPDSDIAAYGVEKLTAISEELKTGKPVQYILGSTEFYGLSFLVNPSVLIPRPETEELVEWIISLAGSRQLAAGSQKTSILDIGTGSGCIAISLKKNLPDTEVTAVDISVDALNTAKQNAVINQVDVEFVEADILLANQPLLTVSYSIIVSNPPYVTLQDKFLMHVNVTEFEPHSALFVPENDPLIFYKAIADFAAQHLTENGSLFFEINKNMGKETIDLLSAKGFTNMELRQDMSGRDRMVKATCPI